MKNIFIILTLLYCNIIYTQEKDFKKTIDSILHSFQQNNAFSGEVLIQQDGKTVYNGKFNSFESNSDLYRIGSVTKIFTAVMIFQLIEEGKLSLDTTLSKYYPDIKNADEITIANLLNHTSGIYNYLEWEDYYASKQQVFTKNQLIDLIKNNKPDFKPGKDVFYSNSGYLLLGYIIEDITKQSLIENLNNRIVNKIGLKNTYFETDVNDYAKRNSSYFFDGEKFNKEADTHPSFTLAAGGMVSNTENLSKFMNALFNRELISLENLQKMVETNQRGFGYGLQYFPFNETYGFGHSGRLDEFHSFTGLFPKEKVSISVLSNGAKFKLNDVVLAIMSIFYNKPYNKPDFSIYKSTTSTDIKKFTGIYKAKLIGIINIGTLQITEALNDHLFLSMDEEGGLAGQKVLLERKAENKYYARINNAEFDFEVDKQGNVTGLKLTQNKQSIYCKKIK